MNELPVLHLQGERQTVHGDFTSLQALCVEGRDIVSARPSIATGEFDVLERM